MSLLVISEIFGLFINKLTVDDKYSLCNTEKLTHSIQMQFSKKERTFVTFLQHCCSLHQRTFNKNDESHSLYI